MPVAEPVDFAAQLARAAGVVSKARATSRKLRGNSLSGFRQLRHSIVETVVINPFFSFKDVVQRWSCETHAVAGDRGFLTTNAKEASKFGSPEGDLFRR